MKNKITFKKISKNRWKSQNGNFTWFISRAKEYKEIRYIVTNIVPFSHYGNAGRPFASYGTLNEAKKRITGYCSK